MRPTVPMAGVLVYATTSAHSPGEGGSGRPDLPSVGRRAELVPALPRCIPHRYHSGMSTQIAVRLSDDLVAFVDDLVTQGDATSRAAVVSRALERERRRKVAERDAAILARTGADADLDSLAKYAASTPMGDLD